jgi:hypothetical protein
MAGSAGKGGALNGARFNVQKFKACPELAERVQRIGLVFPTLNFEPLARRVLELKDLATILTNGQRRIGL